MEQYIKKIFTGFIYIHILYHASKEPVYGVRMMEELESHGYRIGPGTLYPLLHRMETDGLLISQEETVNSKVRKYYRATAEGVSLLERCRRQVDEMRKEIVDDKPEPDVQ